MAKPFRKSAVWGLDALWTFCTILRVVVMFVSRGLQSRLVQSASAEGVVGLVVAVVGLL